MPRIGVALSGGGHRATLWGWGALLALTDVGAHRDVVSISSVSGGSIASGVVANAGDYAAMSGDDLERALRPGLRIAARQGLFFFGPATDTYLARFLLVAGIAVGAVVSALLAVVGGGRGWPPVPFLAVGPVLVAVAWLVWLRSGTLPRRMATALSVGLGAGGLLAVPALALVRRARGWDLAWRLVVVVAIAAVLVALLVRVFGRRSQVVDDALARTLLHRDGRPTRLADVESTVHHVFCATELQGGDHVYLTPRLVYGYRVGAGHPGELRLSTAVQCSACLPGAFVARELPTGGFDLARPWDVADGQPEGVPPLLVLNDGGVYDNMADQWEQGFGDRSRRVEGLAERQAAADTLVVVNASKALGWGRMRRARGLGAEVRGLTRSVDILYDVSTSHRRQGLVSRFRSGGRDDLRGVLVHIAQSPFDLPRAFAGGDDPDAAARAAEALEALHASGADEATWAARADASPSVPTVLAAVGPDVAADLLEHAYLLTTVNCYVVLGLGELDADRLRGARARFEALV